MTQRELKFRVWDDGRKEWVHGPGNEVNLFGETIVFGEILRRPDDTSVSLDELNDLVALQYSGLLDKHGKEIYEGDILKFIDHKHETRHIGPVVWGRYEMSGFDIPTWTAKNGNRGGIGLFPVNFKKPVVDMEVVGNIYSNPELVDPKMIER